LVLDFCPGGDLETMLSASREPFSEAKARFYIAEIIIAIKDLHRRDIIYRDLKPSNVVIDDLGHA
jgi:serine/threonine protein kinase